MAFYKSGMKGNAAASARRKDAAAKKSKMDDSKPKARVIKQGAKPKSAKSSTSKSSPSKSTPSTGSFSDAFKAARKVKGAGKTFTYNGKSYSTNTKAEGIGIPTAKSAGMPMKPKKAGVPKGSPVGTGTVLRNKK